MKSRRGARRLNTETIELLRNEPELLAIADAITSTHRRRTLLAWRSAGRLMLIAGVAAAAVSVAVGLPLRDEHDRIIEKANAALGRRPIFHLRVQTRDPAQGVVFNTRTGRTVGSALEFEAWFDLNRLRLHAITRHNGVTVGEAVETLSRSRLLAPSRRMQVFPVHADGVVAFAVGYPLALRADRTTVIGPGSFRDTPVTWIQSEMPPKTVMRVALSRATGRPIAFRRVTSTRLPEPVWKVVTAETTALRRTQFETRREPTSRPSNTAIDSSSISLSHARTALAHGALWPGRRVLSVRLGAVRLLILRARSSTSARELGRALELRYGRRIHASATRARAGFLVIQVSSTRAAVEGVLARSFVPSVTPPPTTPLLEVLGLRPRPGASPIWLGRIRKGRLDYTLWGSTQGIVVSAVRQLRSLPR